MASSTYPYSTGFQQNPLLSHGPLPVYSAPSPVSNEILVRHSGATSLIPGSLDLRPAASAARQRHAPRRIQPPTTRTIRVCPPWRIVRGIWAARMEDGTRDAQATRVHLLPAFPVAAFPWPFAGGLPVGGVTFGSSARYPSDLRNSSARRMVFSIQGALLKNACGWPS